MAKIWDYVVVGGGAAGLATAVFCARFSTGNKVIVLEKNSRVGKKLLATGNGTCNITNMTASPSHYHGDGADAFVKKALDAFSSEKTIDFFRSIGVHCVSRENGRVYPLCEQAGAVLDCLRLTLERLGVTIQCDSEVTALSRKGELLQVAVGEQVLEARHVLIATGGAAAPSLGGSAQSYALPLSVGHKKTPLFPSIVQVRTDTAFVRAMKGLRTDATVSFYCDGNLAAQETGEVLFTEYGISGPAVMQISRVVGDWERRKRGDLTATLDLLPSVTTEDLYGMLQERQTLGRRGEDFLTGLLHKRIGQTAYRAAGLSLSDSGETLTKPQLQRLCRTIKAFPLTVTGTQGFGGAQVTAGGIALNEVDPVTLRSRLDPHVYLLGEVLDVDGDCGGFNLQWAWASAYAAALAATGGTL